MSQPGVGDPSPAEIVATVLAEVSGRPAAVCREDGLDLLRDLGIDSLALAEMVEMLQERLGIVVPDEVTASLRSVNDVRETVTRLSTHDESKDTR